MTDSKLIQEFIERLEFVKSNTQLNKAFISGDKAERINRAKKDYAFFVKTYFSHIAPDDNADFHNKAAYKILREPRIKAVLKWFRGAAKSTHSTIFIPLWLWINNQMKFMILIGAESGIAKGQLSELQAEFEANELLKFDFGNMTKYGDWSEGEFILKDNTKFISRGKGQKLRGLRYRGHRPDYIVMDDIDDDETCENPDRVKKLIKWIKNAVLFVGDIGNFRVIISNNLIAQMSVTAHFSKHKSWWHNQVNAIDDLGNPAWFQKYTKDYYQQLRQEDEIAFQSEMMNNPHIEGEIFKEAETQFAKMNWATMRKCNSVVAKWDIAYTRNKSSDFNAVTVIGFLNDKILVFKSYCRQSLMSEALNWMYNIDREANQHNVEIIWYAEKQFWNEPVKDAVEKAAKTHGYWIGIIMDDNPQANKIKRIIKGLASFWQNRKIFFNEFEKENYDLKTGLGQLNAIDYDYHGKDDYPDALEATVAKGKRFCGNNNSNIILGKNSQIKDRY